VRAEFDLFSARFVRRFVAVAAIAILAAGCGDDSGGDEPAAGGGGGSGGGGGGGSSTLAISGTPPSQIMQGVALDYTPTISNPAGLTLTFAPVNFPSWMSINSSTGRITGTPGPSHVGVYTNIRVTVSAAGQSVTSAAYSITVVSAATGSTLLSWQAPTQRVDGTPLGASLAGYRIYYGQSPSNLDQTITINSVGITSHVVSNLTPATWYFAATAVDTNGIESGYSNIGAKTIQ
jgi:hypothetical protein